MRDALSAVPRCRPVEMEVLQAVLHRAPDLAILSIAEFVASWDRDGGSMFNQGRRLSESPPKTRKQK